MVVAPLHGDPASTLTCPLLQELEELMDGYGKSIAGLYEVFKRIERPGPGALGTKLFHLVDESSKVYEFIKGDVRVFCFLAPSGAICVCCSALIKKGRKADKGAVKRTADLAREYQDAMTNGAVEMYTEQDGKFVKDTK